MDWAARLTLAPRNLVLVAGYGVALVAVSPALSRRRRLLVPLLVAVAGLATLVYLRYGLLALRAPCETCGERSHLGAIWCRRLGTVRTRLSRPLVQAVAAVALVVLIGWTAEVSRTFALWIAIHDGPVWHYLLSDDPVFRAILIASATAAAVPVPVLAGNVLRVSVRGDASVRGGTRE